MTTAKIYYLKQTGEVILHIPENHSQWAKPTTREQDEALYNALQAYNPQEVDLLELEPGQYTSDFLSATSYRVNLETLELEFLYPTYHPPLTSQIEQLAAENVLLKSENEALKAQLDSVQQALDEIILGGGM
jgi:hypothetical protein